MSNTTNPQLEKLKVEYQEIILECELPCYLRQEVALLFFLLGKEKNTFFWDKYGSSFLLRAAGDAVVELYSLAEILGMDIQTSEEDTDDTFTLFSTRASSYIERRICDLLTEMVNTAFPEAPIQHFKEASNCDYK